MSMPAVFARQWKIALCCCSCRALGSLRPLRLGCASLVLAGSAGTPMPTFGGRAGRTRGAPSVPASERATTDRGGASRCRWIPAPTSRVVAPAAASAPLQSPNCVLPRNPYAPRSA